MEAIETNLFGGRIVEHKEINVAGVRVGVIKGYIAAWGPDTGGRFGIPDQFHRGAFLESLQEHRDRGNRQIRLKDMHGRVIGGFPIETVMEDENGLWAEGHINLETQLGREAYSLIKQGVLEDMSIGFSSRDDKIQNGVRDIFKALVWEGSIVDEPAHRGAKILEWKAAVPFQDLPLADRGRAWDAAAAKKRVQTATGSEDEPSAGYKKAFLWYDSTEPNNFGSYKLPIADVVDGRMVAIPRAIFAAAAALRGARGGVAIPESDVPKVINHLERYYAKMDMDSPWDREERQFVGHVEVKGMSADDIEEALRRGAAFSKAAAREVKMRLLGEEEVSEPREAAYDEKALRALVDDIRDAARSLRERRVLRS